MEPPIYVCICAGMGKHGLDIIRHHYDDVEWTGPRVDWGIMRPMTRKANARVYAHGWAHRVESAQGETNCNLHSQRQGARNSCTQVKKSNDVITHEASWARPAGRFYATNPGARCCTRLPMRMRRGRANDAAKRTPVPAYRMVQQLGTGNRERRRGRWSSLLSKRSAC